MKWAVAAPFIDQTNVHSANWLEKYVPGEKHDFLLIPRGEPLQKWHDRKSKFTPPRDWVLYWKQATSALNSDADGVITVFPQLAANVGIQNSLRLRKKPVIAWLFNVGTCSVGLRQRLAKISSQNVDRFVVHTRREIQIYSEWLNLPKERFEFVPYQVPDIEVNYKENTLDPFITSLGSAHRDFPTLIKAAEKLNIKTIIATGKGALAGVQIPSQIETPYGISKEECIKLGQQARLNIIPLQPKKGVTAAGQVTIVEAMMMGRPLIVSNYYGAEDYIIHGETGWLVEPGSLDSLLEAIDTLWNDHQLRQTIGKNAQVYAKTHFSDFAAAKHLKRILDGYLR